MAGFPWNIAQPQLHLLSLTVKISDVEPRISISHIAITQNLQYKMHPEYSPAPRLIFTLY